jgi:hypothetical protein
VAPDVSEPPFPDPALPDPDRPARADDEPSGSSAVAASLADPAVSVDVGAPGSAPCGSPEEPVMAQTAEAAMRITAARAMMADR